eukprot:1358524-Amorphochlora_amoeboformis.AAC.2
MDNSHIPTSLQDGPSCGSGCHIKHCVLVILEPLPTDPPLSLTFLQSSSPMLSIISSFYPSDINRKTQPHPLLGIVVESFRFPHLSCSSFCSRSVSLGLPILSSPPVCRLWTRPADNLLSFSKTNLNVHESMHA